MSDPREVVVLSGVRTAIGGYGGSLKDHPPSDLAALEINLRMGKGALGALFFEPPGAANPSDRPSKVSASKR